MKELKLCPFCGKEVDVYFSYMTKGYYVAHKETMAKCWCQMPLLIRGAESLESAKEAWNRRANDNV